MRATAEDHARSCSFGKWSDPGVPHRGWQCIEVQDLGEPSMVCEMCETMTIRYVHHMDHEEYPQSLACGCICAGHMEQDLDAARERERSLLKQARFRKRLAKQWASPYAWTLSASGNPTIRLTTHMVTLFWKADGYHWVIRDRATDLVIYSSQTWQRREDAQADAFERIVAL